MNKFMVFIIIFTSAWRLYSIIKNAFEELAVNKQSDIIVHGYPCNVPRYHSKVISESEFYQHYNKSPFIISNHNDAIREKAKISVLLEEYGNTSIIVSSSNTHSHDQQQMSFRDYMANHVSAITLENDALDTWYFFGDQGPEWNELLSYYNVPEHAPEPTLAFGIGMLITQVLS